MESYVQWFWPSPLVFASRLLLYILPPRIRSVLPLNACPWAAIVYLSSETINKKYYLYTKPSLKLWDYEKLQLQPLKLAPRFPEYISMLTHLRQMADIMRNQTLKLWYSGYSDTQTYDAKRTKYQMVDIMHNRLWSYDNQILRYLLHKWQHNRYFVAKCATRLFVRGALLDI